MRFDRFKGHIVIFVGFNWRQTHVVPQTSPLSVEAVEKRRDLHEDTHAGRAGSERSFL